MSGNTWKYVTKSEWKVATRAPKTEEQAVQAEKKEKTYKDYAVYYGIIADSSLATEWYQQPNVMK